VNYSKSHRHNFVCPKHGTGWTYGPALEVGWGEKGKGRGRKIREREERKGRGEIKGKNKAA